MIIFGRGVKGSVGLEEGNKRASGKLVMFYFWIWERISWVCSVCKQSSNWEKV